MVGILFSQIGSSIRENIGSSNQIISVLFYVTEMLRLLNLHTNV